MTRMKSLADLRQVQQTLEQQRVAAAARAEAERQQARRADAARNLFTRAVGAVAPLQHAPRVKHATPLPQPEPLQQVADEQAALRESLSDEFDASTLLEVDEHLSYRKPGIGRDVLQKLRRGHWAIQGEVDLHGLRRDEAREQLGAFIREAMKQGLRCVRVVHGKGLGSPGKTPVLKGRVQGWLVQKKEVLAFVQARPLDGGAGALVVLLDRAGA